MSWILDDLLDFRSITYQEYPQVIINIFMLSVMAAFNEL